MQVLVMCMMLSVTFCINATGNYQAPSDFIQEVFSGDVPKISKIWIKKDLKKRYVKL